MRLVRYRKSLLAFAALLTAALAVSLSLDGCTGYYQLDRTPGESERRENQGRQFEYALSINPYELTAPEMQEALDLAQEAGVNSIVSGAAWWYIAPHRYSENYRLEPMDSLLRETRRRNMKLSIQVTGTPDWVHPELRTTVRADSRRIWYPPRGQEEVQHFSDFVGFLVDRYGTQVERYEIWNEPNSFDFWEPTPNANEYAALLRPAYLEAKRTNPDVTVAFGGLSMNDIGFLEEYYEAARRYPGARESNYFFDLLNVHPYTYGQSPDWKGPDRKISGPNGPLDQSFTGLSEMKFSMERNRDGDKRIFVGEFGYPTASTEDTWMEPLPDHRRAFYLKRAYALARELPYVTGMCWYYYMPDSVVGREWTMLDENLTPSMTYQALKQATGAAEEVAKVRLSTPQNPVSGTHTVDPLLSGVDMADARRWELYANGKLVKSSDQAPFVWNTQAVENGSYSLMLAMYARTNDVWISDPIFLSVRNS